MNYKILINKENKYQEIDFCNRVLEKYYNFLGKEILVEKKTLHAFLLLQEALKIKGCAIDIVNGYRSLKEPNEHCSGLCIDIGFVENNNLIDDNDVMIGEKYSLIFETIIFPMLKEYGFILRYPRGKENITGYSYKPWHFRYVGKSSASIIMKNNITLEEYHHMYQKSGVLVVNKPKGMTSRDVVNQIERIFDTKKVGHNGTLDPLAEGVLIITINKATKINDLLTSTNKSYLATVIMGIETDTLDTEGKIVRKQDVSIRKEQIEKVLQEFEKEYEQEVPIYSAVKINGKKLYEYARNNEKVELPKRNVQIMDMKLVSFYKNTFSFSCTVSKGTYIRSLIRDIGKKLGVCCTMSKLVRTKQGAFDIEQAIALKDITVSTKLLKMEEVLPFEKVELDTETYHKIKNGMKIDNKYHVKDKVLFLYQNQAVAIYQKVNERLKVFKML